MQMYERDPSSLRASAAMRTLLASCLPSALISFSSEIYDGRLIIYRYLVYLIYNDAIVSAFFSLFSKFDIATLLEYTRNRYILEVRNITVGIFFYGKERGAQSYAVLTNYARKTLYYFLIQKRGN